MIARELWNEAAAKGLSVSLGDDLNIVKAEVMRGVSALWSLDSGWIVTRVEDSEIVVVALENCSLKKAVPMIIQIAKDAGFMSVRCHTSSAALERYLCRFGAVRREIVLEVIF